MAILSKSLLAIHGNDTEAADAEVRLLRDFLVANYRTMLSVVFGGIFTGFLV
jgi:hypothetical protein